MLVWVNTRTINIVPKAFSRTNTILLVLDNYILNNAISV